MLDIAKVIPQQPQRQDSVRDQLYDLKFAAVKLGMYDAADWLEARINYEKSVGL